MTSALGYIQSGTFSTGGGGFTAPAGAWCRPKHRATCCMAISHGNSCCVCVPTTATCYVIEMWGQGGGGGGGCCCGVGSYGGQGGAYGWVACTTSGTNHILCACTCLCLCSTCGICSGTPGQFSRVYNCNGTGGVSGQWCVCGGTAGLWCCFPNAPWCWAGGTQNPTGTSAFKYNTWKLFKDCSVCLAGAPAAAAATAAAGQALQFCCSTQGGLTPDTTTFTGCAACTAPSSGSGSTAANILDNYIPGQLCSCSAFSSPYVWLGACGWSDAALCSGATHCLNIACANASNGPVNANCGGGMGNGGAAYAGGDQAVQKCSFACGSCWVQCGNFPGGGGMSTFSQTAWGQPGWGAPGLILISWS